jgi:hypothetical protein
LVIRVIEAVPRWEEHASWLDRAEIYFSVVQRKALTPDGFTSLSQIRTAARGEERAQ